MGIIRDLRDAGRDIDFTDRVEAAAEQYKISEYAREVVREQNAEQNALMLPHAHTLDDFTKIYDRDPVFTIEGLLPQGGTALLYGPEKAGKSHLTANAIRSLADGTPFLDRYATQQRRVTLIDLELNDATLAKWLRAQNIVNTQNVRVITLKGQASQFNILDRAGRENWAEIIAATNADGESTTDFLILDCLWPILAALDLDENKDAGRFLAAFDELKFEACIDDAIVVHHSGKEGRGPRGDSKMGGWADALWEIDVQDRNDPHSRRYFSARGRDVAETQQQLLYDHDTRQLTLAEGTRKEAKVATTIEAVVAYLGSAASEAARTGRAIRDALAAEHADGLIREALKEAEAQGITTIKPGPRRSTIHTLKGVIPSSVMSGIQCDNPTASGSSFSVSVGPIGTHTHTHPGQHTDGERDEASITLTHPTALPASKTGAVA